MRILEKIIIRILMKFNINQFNFGFTRYKDKSLYGKIHQKAKENISNEVTIFENKNGYKIDEGYLSKLSLHTQVVVKKTPINLNHGRVLYSLLRKYIEKRKNEFHTYNISIIETGTARGFSSICMSKALLDAGIDGNIYTIDILPHKTKMYWNVIDDFEGKKTRKELISFWNKENKKINFLTGKSLKILKNLSVDRINFAFLDSSHEFQIVNEEFEIIQNKQQKGDFLVFDDYSPNKYNGVVKVVNRVVQKNIYKVEFININDNRILVVCEKN